MIPSAITLSPVRVEEVSTFLFINLDQDATSLQEDVGDCGPLMAEHFPDLEDLELVDELDYEVAANWKVIVENAIEGYHFSVSGPVHRDLTALIRFEEYELEERGKWWSTLGPTEPGMSDAFGESIGDAKYQTTWFFNLFFWPHTSLYAFPFADFVGSFCQYPVVGGENPVASRLLSSEARDEQGHGSLHAVDVL